MESSPIENGRSDRKRKEKGRKKKKNEGKHERAERKSGKRKGWRGILLKSTNFRRVIDEKKNVEA
ncbi:hypothetical protein K0M31_018164 [Melipona bicolor]|uniref:Uncharacterized protein n=1 Tax=Melipona bicolor TaxID=60889 RepID=A0AA40FCX6_9HYME|nr:hypothetical protein K0M31_018164 [Melipona bicolor]